MDKQDKRSPDRPESYPQPTKTDKQLHGQPEFIDQQPNDFHDKSVSDIPGSQSERQTSDPSKETQRKE